MTVLVDRSDHVVGEAFLRRKGRHVAVAQTDQTATIGADPEVALQILQQSQRRVVRQAILGRQHSSAGPRHARDAIAQDTNPQIAVSIGKQRENRSLGA